MKRETAWRIFASEYNDSTYEQKGSGEKQPSYVITPLGGRVNRIYLVGVLTDVENVAENGEFLRAHISDPTGVFTIYSGQYQKEATQQLQNIDVPAFVAIVGKTRTYEPEEGTILVSIRPEIIKEVDAKARDRWIVETSIQTKNRIEAMTEAMKMNQPNSYDLKKLGFSYSLSEGIVTALKHYQNVDLGKYISLIKESLQYMAPHEETFDEIIKEEKKEKLETKKTAKKKKKEPESIVDQSEDNENIVLETIKKIEGDDGASWDNIIEKCKKKGLDENTIEEALTSLMDKGFIFEPVLGTIKTT